MPGGTAGAGLPARTCFAVLAHPGDRSAVRVAAALRRRHGDAAVVLAAAEQLTLAAGWEHRLTSVGAATTTITLPDGATLDSDDLAAVLNRLQYAPAPHFTNAPAADRDYAVMELHAVLLSWLHSLGSRVVNPPTTQGLCGTGRGLLEWMALAAGASLATPRLRWTTNARRDEDLHLQRLAPGPVDDGLGGVALAPMSPAAAVLPLGQRALLSTEPLTTHRLRLLVTGDRVGAEAAEIVGEDVAAAAVRLAAAARCPLLEVTLAGSASDPDRWMFAGAAPLPELAGAGVEAAVTLLEHVAAGRRWSPPDPARAGR